MHGPNNLTEESHCTLAYIATACIRYRILKFCMHGAVGVRYSRSVLYTLRHSIFLGAFGIVHAGALVQAAFGCCIRLLYLCQDGLDTVQLALVVFFLPSTSTNTPLCMQFAGRMYKAKIDLKS